MIGGRLYPSRKCSASCHARPCRWDTGRLTRWFASSVIGGQSGTYAGIGYPSVTMRRLWWVVMALAVAGCGRERVPPPAPASRAEACARITDPTLVLDQFAFCDRALELGTSFWGRDGGAVCHSVAPQIRRAICMEAIPGEQPLCFSEPNPPLDQTEVYPWPIQPCGRPSDYPCPQQWECRRYSHPNPPSPSPGVTHWCFPGPRCDGRVLDAGARDASGD